jgi:hypothetical protein
MLLLLRGSGTSLALHRAGVTFGRIRRSARLALRIALSVIRTIAPRRLLGLGQSRARDQRRCRNSSQQAFPHLEFSFVGGELPDA